MMLFPAQRFSTAASRTLGVATWCLLLTASALAQSGPTPEQEAAFSAGRLRVEGVEILNVTPGYRPPGAVYTPAPTVSRQFTWRPFRGDEQISEVEFYRLVGRTDLADRTRSRLRTRTTLIVAGLVAGAVGTVAAGLGVGSREEAVPPLSPGDPPLTTVGDDYVLMGAGLGLAVVGGLGIGLGVQLGRRRAAPVQAAGQMADQYNERLAEMLMTPPRTTDI